MKKEFEVLGQWGLVSLAMVALWFFTGNFGFLVFVVPLLILLFMGE